MARAVGIDLGTTDSVVCVLQDGEPTVIPNAEGFRTTPSVVAFAKDGEVLVGEAARRQAVTNASRTVCSVKRRMGTDWSVPIDEKTFSAQQISAFVLRKLKRDAEAYLGEKVTAAVITVPAYFCQAQRQATREAGELAGLDVPRVISEPSAAGLGHALGKRGKTALVVRLGGGTFDVSLVDVAEDAHGEHVVQVKATSGDDRLGGDDWDQAVADYLVTRFENLHGVDLSSDKTAMQRLREAAEAAKIELSSSSQTTIELPYLAASAEGPLHLYERVTRARFQELTRGLLERSEKVSAAVERERLGGHQTTYHAKPRGLMVPAVLAAAFLVLTGIGITIPNMYQVAVCGLLTAVFGALLLGARYANRRYAQLQIFEQGLVVVDADGRPAACRWDALSVRQKVVDHYHYGVPQGRSHAYTLKGPDGETLLHPGVIPYPEHWGPAIQDAVTEAQLPIALAAVRRGETVSFGDISVNRDAVTAYGRSVTWDQIRQISVEAGTVSLNVAGKWLPLTSRKVSQIPNFFVFHALAEHLRRSA
ncbi:Hsp70 family protein [Streptomyces sp. ISL-99]|uniref:DUF6585 family protein n=1 Tax=Streptomyces sp. ISL-99 TaxID=2819193 RepID=UPI001BE594C7|nr:DUF6585 family protein [Streptomyces sp. ISL-99]MBT2528668.1 Hsp70 family protein [Streptomyces sp. ISL-99]